MTGFALEEPVSGRHRAKRETEGRPRRIAVLLFLFLATAFASVASADQTESGPPVRARMERAIALLAADDADGAIPILLSVVDEIPRHGPARFQLGALAVERGEWEVAADHLDAATRSYGPQAPDGAVPVQRPGLAWALYSDALGQTGRLDEALAATASALRFAPDYLPVLLGRSDFARRLSRETASGETELLIETALDAARKALALAPDRPGPWTALALAAHEAEVPELARCAAARAAELAPDDARARFLVAWTAADADPEGALTAAEAALAGGLRDDPALWMTLGRLRAFRLDMEGSLDAYREALRLDPASAGEMASVALDAIVAGGDPELLPLLESRATRRSDALNTRFALAKAALREGQVKRAADELVRLADLAPNHAAILTSLYAALRRAGDGSAAEAVLVRLAAVQDAEADAWERANRVDRDRGRARDAAVRGDWDEAVRRWEAVLGARDDADSLRLAADLAEFGGILGGLARHRDALAALHRSLALHPFDSETLSVAVRVARALGDHETAERHAVRARLTDPACRSERRPPADIAPRRGTKLPPPPAWRTQPDGALPVSHPGPAHELHCAMAAETLEVAARFCQHPIPVSTNPNPVNRISGESPGRRS